MDGWPQDPVREALLRAGLEVFSRDGFFATSPQAIAREAKLAVGTLYSRFDGRAGLAKILIQEIVETLNWRITRATRSNRPPRQRLQAALAAVFDFVYEDTDAGRILLFQKHVLCPRVHVCGGEVPTSLASAVTLLRNDIPSSLTACWIWGLAASTLREILSARPPVPRNCWILAEEACWALVSSRFEPVDTGAPVEQPAQPDDDDDDQLLRDPEGSVSQRADYPDGSADDGDRE